MRVVILTPIPYWHPGTGELIERLIGAGLNIWAFDIFNGITIDNKGIRNDLKPKYLNGVFGKIYLKLFRRSIISRQIRDNDILDIHFVEPAYGRYLNMLTSKKTKIITTLFGSDLFRTSPSQKRSQAPLFRNADRIVLSKNMIPYFEEHFPGYEDKFYLNQYGSIRLDLVDSLSSIENRKEIRKRYGIEENKIVICCGYNAKKQQRHMKMLEGIGKISETERRRLFLLLPLTYGIDESGAEYVREIKARLNELGISNLLVEDRVTDEAIAELRVISDITINIQTTDALASSIKEAMVAGDIVMVGDWLPYEIYKDLGIFFLTTPAENLSSDIKGIVDNFEELRQKSKSNRQKILDFASWKVLIDRWVEFYKEV